MFQKTAKLLGKAYPRGHFWDDDDDDDDDDGDDDDSSLWVGQVI